MTDTFFAQIGQARCQKLWLDVPWSGPWVVRAILDDVDSDITGQVTITLGSLQLVGTVDPDASGTFVQQRSCTIVAGGGGWGKNLEPKWYQSDAGIPPTSVARDAATECGERLGSVDFGPNQLPPYYMRTPGPASNTLERLLEGSGGDWWVDQSGITHAGKRPTSQAQSGTYSVLAYSPMNRWVRIQASDPASLWVGSTLTDRFKNPKTIRSLVIELDAGKLIMYAWLGDEGATRIGHALEAIIAKELQKRLLGKYLYRVFAMDGERANLQAVRSGGISAPLTDALPVTISYGVPGIASQLKPGQKVWVEFGQGGNPEYPIVTAFDDTLPQSVALCVPAGGTGKPIAGLGDTVDVFFPPEAPISATVVGTITAGALTGTITILNSLVGIISSGSDLASVGSSQ